MLSKSLIQFSVDGWSCVPSLPFTWGQTMVEVMKILVISLKRSHACTATVRAPNPAGGHDWPTPLRETPGHSQASLGQSPVGSLLLSPGFWCTRFYCALQQESISQSCVSSGSSAVGLMTTSSKRTYAIPTGHGTTDWFQIEKGVPQGHILSPCLFTLYAEYIMRNDVHPAGLDEEQLESRLLGETSITSDLQKTPPLWQEAKN